MESFGPAPGGLLLDIIKMVIAGLISACIFKLLTRKSEFTPKTYNKHMLSQRICTIPSHTFNEYLLLPALTTEDCQETKVSLKTPLCKFRVNSTPELQLTTPMVSACMQSVSGVEMAVELAKHGGCAFIFCSQPINEQAKMVREVKERTVDPAFPNASLDAKKKYLVGAGVNTKDYETRIPALVDAGADVLCIDSSDGHSVWQKKTIEFVRQRYGDSIKIGAGNVVTADGFLYLADAGCDFCKVGIGGGSICITREQKGIGRSQASALIDVCEARDRYEAEHKVYIPVCSDGGIVQDYHITLALAMGADFVMLGRYFSRFDESPTKVVKVNRELKKEYWGEGSERAKNWQRYSQTEDMIIEGVDSYVDYIGPMFRTLAQTLKKIKATMCNCGCTSLKVFKHSARLTVVSSVSVVEGGAHDVMVKSPFKEMPQDLME